MATRASRSKRDRSGEGTVASSKKKDHITPAEGAEGWVAEAGAAERLAACKGRDISPEQYAIQAKLFRKEWERLFASDFGDFEQTTKIPPMRFTDVPAPGDSFKMHTLQIFSVKIAKLKEGIQWPLHVFGKVAIRDPVDRNRNLIFNRERDNCQILTQKNQSLALIGPTRAVVLLLSVNFEVELKVKGPTESEDKDLSYLAERIGHFRPSNASLQELAYNSNLCTLLFTYGHIPFSVEATISVQVIDGSWHGFGGEIFACTASFLQEVFLLDSGEKEMPVSGGGMINLSREVVSVESKGKLTVYVKVWSGHSGNFIMMKRKEFIPKEAGRSHGFINVGFCKMKVNVAWSLLSAEPPTEGEL
ncbi:hypothetical protein ACP70R_036157 [Stipagrostis hirtigluma subsp. patula]